MCCVVMPRGRGDWAGAVRCDTGQRPGHLLHPLQAAGRAARGLLLRPLPEDHGQGERQENARGGLEAQGRGGEGDRPGVRGGASRPAAGPSPGDHVLTRVQCPHTCPMSSHVSSVFTRAKCLHTCLPCRSWASSGRGRGGRGA